ncbi:MAG: KH domain-containing protein [Clostridiales bacterium]|nr:KH domain-containing protein [Clostridiales bacterium]
MLELIKFIVNRFAEKQDDIEYIVKEEGNVVNVTVVLDESDMGKVIGRQGKLAKALRTIVRSASAKENKKYNVEIKAKGEI